MNHDNIHVKIDQNFTVELTAKQYVDLEFDESNFAKTNRRKCFNSNMPTILICIHAFADFLLGKQLTKSFYVDTQTSQSLQSNIKNAKKNFVYTVKEKSTPCYLG